MNQESELTRSLADAQEAHVKVNTDWTPTSANINALPDAIRGYIHDLETRADPAHEIREIWLLRDQLSALTRSLANAQERHARNADAPAFNTPKTLYRLYTEYVLSRAKVAAIVGRYYAGATIYRGLGLDARTQDTSEEALIIEIVSSLPDALQRVVNLAGDLRHAGNQISVLVTVQDVRTFEITEAEPVRVSGRPLDRPSRLADL